MFSSFPFHILKLRYTDICMHKSIRNLMYIYVYILQLGSEQIYWSEWITEWWIIEQATEW